MAKKTSIHAISEEEALAKGLEKTGRFYKICKHCKKPFYSDARRQAYCCSECQKKAAEEKKRNKKHYDKTAPIQRLNSRSHAMAVDIIKYLVTAGKREWKCECCGAVESEKTKLEIHHQDLNFFNNTPSNLKILCHRCHSKAHSDLEKSLDAQGILVQEYYDQSMIPFVSVINKRFQK